jgi:hypothetical protein
MRTFKLTPSWYLPHFVEEAAAHGIKVRLVQDRHSRSRAAAAQEPAFVYVFNRIYPTASACTRRVVVEPVLSGARSANGPSSASRSRTRLRPIAWYTGHGIPMPRLVDAKGANGAAVSRTPPSGSSAADRRARARCGGRSHALQHGLHRHEAVGRRHRLLRVAAGTGRRLRLPLRLCPRPAGRRGQRVGASARHADRREAAEKRSTPDSAVPNRPAIETLCRRIGQTLGLGFYAHDIQTWPDCGTLYSETGINDSKPLRSVHTRPSPTRSLLLRHVLREAAYPPCCESPGRGRTAPRRSEGKMRGGSTSAPHQSNWAVSGMRPSPTRSELRVPGGRRW